MKGMGNNFSVFPGEMFTATASVANNVLDKIEHAVGFIVTPRGKKKDFEEAVSCYIDEIKNNQNLSPLIKAAMISNARKNIKEYINQNDIVNIGMDNMANTVNIRMDDTTSTVNMGGIDDDWLMYFFDKAKNISNEQLKIIWGKLLAEEVISGGVSKKLLHILSVISPEDAAAFGNVCNYYVFVDNVQNLEGVLQIFNAREIGVDNMQRLESLGLINFALAGAATISYEINFAEEEEKVVELRYFGEKIKINVPESQLNLGCASLTKEGEQLRKIIEPKKISTLLQEILDENNKQRKYL